MAFATPPPCKHLVCTDRWNVRESFCSPVLRTTVPWTRDPKRSGDGLRQELVAWEPAER